MCTDGDVKLANRANWIAGRQQDNLKLLVNKLILSAISFKAILSDGCVDFARYSSSC